MVPKTVKQEKVLVKSASCRKTETRGGSRLVTRNWLPMLTTHSLPTLPRAMSTDL